MFRRCHGTPELLPRAPGRDRLLLLKYLHFGRRSVCFVDEVNLGPVGHKHGIRSHRAGPVRIDRQRPVDRRAHRQAVRTVVSSVPVKLPEEIDAIPDKSGTVLSPASSLPKKKLPESELLPYVAAGCTFITPRLAVESVLMQKAATPSNGFVR